MKTFLLLGVIALLFSFAYITDKPIYPSETENKEIVQDQVQDFQEFQVVQEVDTIEASDSENLSAMSEHFSDPEKRQHTKSELSELKSPTLKHDTKSLLGRKEDRNKP